MVKIKGRDLVTFLFHFSSAHYTDRSHRMVVDAAGGHWKRPINRMYSYNFQVGESYYLPMTDYLDIKDKEAKTELPGPLSFSERIAVNALSDTSSLRCLTLSRQYSRTSGSL